MASSENLREAVKRLNGKGYGAYQSLKGEYDFSHFRLYIDRVPKDPYAPPTSGIFRLRVSQEDAGITSDMTQPHIREVALRDYLARGFYTNCLKVSKGRRGTGNSGIITIAQPKQAILERSSIVIHKGFVEVRFFIGLPAEGRRIAAGVAQTMLFDELPEIVRLSLDNLKADDVYRHIKTGEDAEFLRDNLRSKGLIAFIADGASLPRASGIDQKPLAAEDALPFSSPESLRVEVNLPNAGPIRGMGIPKGVTLIVGGGYHGKSTLLQTLELGIYNQIPADGREQCASLPATVKIRAANGRYVVKSDISMFINNLPYRKDTTAFSSKNASGSTSQAASISEAIEAGAEVVLMDEDTCAANFMIRDKRMQQLVDKKDEPITSFIDKVRQLYEEKGISTVLVMGGSGDYFNVSDRVIQMVEFVPYDVTEKAYKISEDFPTGRSHEGGGSFGAPRERVPIPGNLDQFKRNDRIKISAPTPHKLIFGRNEIDLTDLEQIVETAQTKAIGAAIYYAMKYIDGQKTLGEIAGLIMEDLDREGIDVLDRRYTGDLARFRGLELVATLNRMRGFRVKQAGTE